MFGIELRKIGSVHNLFKDVDAVLSKHKIPVNGISAECATQTVAHSLQKMLQADRHFSVCTIDACAALCQICLSVERKRVYSAAHCISWSMMLPEYRMMLVAMVLDDFRCVLIPEEVE